AQQFLETGSYKRILIVGVDKLSKIIDWNDRNTCVLLGDGAGAAVMGEVSDGRGILSFELGSDGSKGEELYQNEHGVMNMYRREVCTYAIRRKSNSSEIVIEKAGLKKDDVEFLVAHEANIRLMEAARKRIGKPVAKMANSIHKYGNSSSASI